MRPRTAFISPNSGGSYNLILIIHLHNLVSGVLFPARHRFLGTLRMPRLLRIGNRFDEGWFGASLLHSIFL